MITIHEKLKFEGRKQLRERVGVQPIQRPWVPFLAPEMGGETHFHNVIILKV